MFNLPNSSPVLQLEAHLVFLIGDGLVYQSVGIELPLPPIVFSICFLVTAPEYFSYFSLIEWIKVVELQWSALSSSTTRFDFKWWYLPYFLMFSFSTVVVVIG